MPWGTHALAALELQGQIKFLLLRKQKSLSRHWSTYGRKHKGRGFRGELAERPAHGRPLQRPHRTIPAGEGMQTAAASVGNSQPLEAWDFSWGDVPSQVPCLKKLKDESLVNAPDITAVAPREKLKSRVPCLLLPQSRTSFSLVVFHEGRHRRGIFLRLRCI